MTIAEMKQKKAELGLTNEQVTMLSGVPLGTVQKVFGGTTTAPRYQTLRKLEAVFSSSGIPGTLTIRETAHEYMAAGKSPAEKKPGEYTVEDFYALPDDKRAELIDGVFYDMTAPGGPHQTTLIELGVQFHSLVKKNKGTCKVFLAPFDVRLDMDDKTMVEPDLMVICRKDRIQERYCNGAPDLIIEILSASTRKQDLTLKYAKYSVAGVREYWIVDPQERKVAVFNFEKNLLPAIYGFDCEVPVGIWGEEMKIDFAEIGRELDSIYTEKRNDSWVDPGK
ncbi:MAG: Uma2 family endonuclease [Stomatobaculum sp.]|nr:Uma2 family endonuclease [Stomatobaculum sp.]